MTTRHEVCPVAELPPGEKRIVEVDGLSIGVFNVAGEFHALANVCPHQLAPLCEGPVTGDVVAPAVGEYEVVREGELVRCPWHGWKFDIATGGSVHNPHEVSTRTFDVTVEQSTGRPDGSDAQEPSDVESAEQVERYGTELDGDEPPVETYQVEVEADVVVLYV